MPWRDVESLQPVYGGLNELVWTPASKQGRLELVTTTETFFDCGTLPDYHAANMAASGGENVIGVGAVVEGKIERTVLWPSVRVRAGENLVDAIRARNDVTLQPFAAMATDGR
jgi:hypothetical protein